MDKEAWRKQANCLGKDIDIFFADRGDDSIQAVELAKELCSVCAVQQQCLNYAIDNSIRDGIYGGLPPKQRWAYKRERKKNEVK
jgi:WhiB family redox-sensing transcriptional regulator